MNAPATAATAALLAYETNTPTAVGEVKIRAEAGAGMVLLKLSRFPLMGLLVTHDEASCLALHLAAAAQRARAQ